MWTITPKQIRRWGQQIGRWRRYFSALFPPAHAVKTTSELQMPPPEEAPPQWGPQRSAKEAWLACLQEQAPQLLQHWSLNAPDKNQDAGSAEPGGANSEGGQGQGEASAHTQVTQSSKSGASTPRYTLHKTDAREKTPSGFYSANQREQLSVSTLRSRRATQSPPPAEAKQRVHGNNKTAHAPQPVREDTGAATEGVDAAGAHTQQRIARQQPKFFVSYTDNGNAVEHSTSFIPALASAKRLLPPLCPQVQQGMPSTSSGRGSSSTHHNPFPVTEPCPQSVSADSHLPGHKTPLSTGARLFTSSHGNNRTANAAASVPSPKVDQIDNHTSCGVPLFALFSPLPGELSTSPVTPTKRPHRQVGCWHTHGSQADATLAKEFTSSVDPWPSLMPDRAAAPSAPLWPVAEDLQQLTREQRGL